MLFKARRAATTSAVYVRTLSHACLGPALRAHNPLPALAPPLADFVDSGAVAALVPMLLQRQEALREAAGEAVAALCSYHQDGKLAQLEALVQALQAQPDLSTQVGGAGRAGQGVLGWLAGHGSATGSWAAAGHGWS